MEEIYLVIADRRYVCEDITKAIPCKTFEAAKRKYETEFRDSAIEALADCNIDASAMTTEEMDKALRDLNSIIHYNEEFDSEIGQWLDITVIHWGKTNKWVHRIEITKSKVYE